MVAVQEKTRSNRDGVDVAHEKRFFIVNTLVDHLALVELIVQKGFGVQIGSDRVDELKEEWKANDGCLDGWLTG